jgi:hypothetical protein
MSEGRRVPRRIKHEAVAGAGAPFVSNLSPIHSPSLDNDHHGQPISQCSVYWYMLSLALNQVIKNDEK